MAASTRCMAASYDPTLGRLCRTGFGECLEKSRRSSLEGSPLLEGDQGGVTGTSCSSSDPSASLFALLGESAPVALPMAAPDLSMAESACLMHNDSSDEATGRSSAAMVPASSVL